MANFQRKLPGGNWTDVPAYAVHGTYEGTVELSYPEATDRDGLGRACAAIGKPTLHVKSSLMTASGMSWWHEPFSSSAATSACVYFKIYNPRLSATGSLAWWSCSGWQARPTFQRLRIGGDTAACSMTWYYDVEISVEALEDAS